MIDTTQNFEFRVMTCPVERINGIWKFVRKPGRASRCRSLPGHLLHLVLEGGYRLRTNGRTYDIHSGDVIYYHESEEVEWLGNDQTVIFLSVGFTASNLAPLPLDRRTFPSDRKIRQDFQALYNYSLLPGREERIFKTYAALLAILGQIELRTGGFSQIPGYTDGSWWAVEEYLRRNRRFRPTLDELASLANCSRPTIVRLCRRATGTSPHLRLQQLRMEEAKGLLRFSTLTITEVAEYLGYSRLNEFSREFSKYFHHPPSLFNSKRR